MKTSEDGNFVASRQPVLVYYPPSENFIPDVQLNFLSHSPWLLPPLLSFATTKQSWNLLVLWLSFK